VIACVERDLGRVKDAERDFRRCLSLQEAGLGPSSTEVALTLEAYALLLRATGRATDAAAMEARARAIPHGRNEAVALGSMSPTH
jgi:hypothetical protein